MSPPAPKMPQMPTGPFIESRPAPDTVPWHIYWNHTDGIGAACRSNHGCFTIAPENVTCAQCLEVMESEKP